MLACRDVWRSSTSLYRSPCTPSLCIGCAGSKEMLVSHPLHSTALVDQSFLDLPLVCACVLMCCTCCGEVACGIIRGKNHLVCAAAAELPLLAAGKFFWFLLFNYLTLIYFTFFGKLKCLFEVFPGVCHRCCCCVLAALLAVGVSCNYNKHLAHLAAAVILHDPAFPQF